VTIDRALRDFLESLAARSPNTELTYTTGLAKLSEYLTTSRRGHPGLDPASNTTRDLPENMLEAFYLWLSRGGGATRSQPGGRTRGAKSAPSSVSTYTAAASAWVRYLDRRRLLPDGVSYERMRGDLAAVKSKQSYKTPRIDERVVLVLEAVDTAVAKEVPAWFIGNSPPPEDLKPIGDAQRLKWLELLRDRAIIHTLFSSALRREEASNLNRSDLRDGRARRALITGKGRKERVAFFGPDALSAVQDYLAARGDSYEPLFLRHDRARGPAGPNGENWRVSPHAVWETVKKWSRAAGVRATTHHLRHAKATILLNEGAKLEEVQDLLGHASPQTTKLIYAHYTVEHLEDAFDRYSPSPQELIKRARGALPENPVEDIEEEK
jgi:integrase